MILQSAHRVFCGAFVIGAINFTAKYVHIISHKRKNPTSVRFFCGPDETRTRLYGRRDDRPPSEKLRYDILISANQLLKVFLIAAFQFLFPDQHFPLARHLL